MEWVDVIIDSPTERTAQQDLFWTAALGWPQGPPWPGHPAFVSFQPPTGSAYVHRQVLASPTALARVHLDLSVADLPLETNRLLHLGAATVGPAGEWQVMRSPGGMLFCLLPAQADRTRPAAVRHANHVTSRLVQIAIDVPAASLSEEIDFWRLATTWRWQPGDEVDFPGKLFGSTGRTTIQLLLQRLRPHSPETQTRAHIDLGADDVDAEAARLVGLGASIVRPGDGFIALRDPAGMVFCVTGNPPE